jgi:hypothetical protein
LIGQTTGHKVDPEDVSREMRYAKDANGDRSFTIDEFLTSKQIQSYFSRTASKLKGQPIHASNADEIFEAAAEEELYQSTRNDVIAKCGLQHPISYQSYDLCKMNKTENGFRRLTIKMLSAICEYFDIDTSAITSPGLRRPYIDILRIFLQSCPSCGKGTS